MVIAPWKSEKSGNEESMVLDIIEFGFDQLKMEYVKLYLLIMEINVILNVENYYHVHHQFHVYYGLLYVFVFNNILLTKNLNDFGIELIHIGLKSKLSEFIKHIILSKFLLIILQLF